MNRFRSRRRQLTEALAWRPEWWAVALVALAWGALLAGVAGGGHHSGGPASMHDSMPGMPGMHSMPGMQAPGRPGVLAAIPAWGLMSIAMMVPLTLPAVRHVGFNSIRRRRAWAMVLYVAAYVLLWTAFGLAAVALVRLAIDLGVDERLLLVVALGLASAWQLTRTKRRTLIACRRTVPLPPQGRRANAGCIRFALVQWWRCLVSCWPLMLVMAVVGQHNLALMAALTAALLFEERTKLGRKLLRHSAAALAVGAAVLAVAS